MEVEELKGGEGEGDEGGGGGDDVETKEEVTEKSVYVCVRPSVYMYVSVFLISLYGAPLSQRASYLALLFGPDGTVNYDYIVTNSLLIGSRCIPNGAHTNHCRANLAHASKRIKNSVHTDRHRHRHTYTHVHTCTYMCVCLCLYVHVQCVCMNVYITIYMYMM